jgi:hypothetical protein
VRLAKAHFPRGCKSRPVTQLPPEPLGAVQEATNALKHFEKRPFRWARERAGRNMK